MIPNGGARETRRVSAEDVSQGKVCRRLGEVVSTAEAGSGAERSSRYSVRALRSREQRLPPSCPPSPPFSPSLPFFVSLASSFSLSHRLGYDHIDQTEYEVRRERLSLLLVEIFQGRMCANVGTAADRQRKGAFPAFVIGQQLLKSPQESIRPAWPVIIAPF